MSDERDKVNSPQNPKSNNSSDDEVVFYDNKKKYEPARLPSIQKPRQTAKTVNHTVNKKSHNRPANNKHANNRPENNRPAKSAKPAKKNTDDEKSMISKKRMIISITSVVLSTLFIISGIVLLVVYYIFTARVNYLSIDGSMPESSVNSDASSTVSEAKEQSLNTYDGELLNDRQVLNVLLIGADTRYNQDRGNSDTMILISIDTKHKKLKLLSFMRDTYVSIPGYESTKLTHSFSYGGAELTVRTVQLNYGIQIDRYAIVDFNSFKGIIDKLGGIDIELTQEEVDYIDWQTWKNHQADTRHELDASSYTYTPNSEGVEMTKVHLNGRQALWHARNRGEDGICSGDDYVRTERQRDVITLMINDLKNSDFATIMNVVYEIGPMITTNLKASELTTLATNITKYLKYDIVSQSAPDLSMIGQDFVYEDYYPNGERLNVIDIIDWDAFRKKIATYVFEDENPLKAA